MKCLLVEDNTELLNVMRLFIEAAGAICVHAASMETALSLIEREESLTHLLTDWHLGDSTASLVVESIRLKNSGIKIAVYSGSNLSKIESSFLAQNGSTFFRKPAEMDELIHWIKS